MKTAFITGADYGHTGYAIASRFIKEGYRVIVTARRKEQLEKTLKHFNEEFRVQVLGFLLDLRNRDMATEIFKMLDNEHISPDALILNGGDLALGADPAAGTPFFGVTPEYLESVLCANVVGNFHLVQLAASRMKNNGGGAVVFIGSNTAIRPNQNRVPYVTSKGGMNAMSKSIAVDLGAYGIRSNVIMPGTIKTIRWQEMGDRQITNGSMIPIGDISDFEDIANAAYFLASDESKNITGTELVVDGGMTAQLYPEILNTYRKKEIESRKGDL